MDYKHQEIEKKWQQVWENEKTFKSDVIKNKEKCYILDMFPYPSGEGLHVGHPLGYTATDIYSRFKRLKGYNVLHPIGWDAFGLPAEQYALKTGTHPSVTTKKNIKRYKKQLKMLGFSYDWEREINTTDQDYYKWTQWIFLKLYKKGLAYEDRVPVNWCPKLKAVLSNEEVIDGKSDIGGYSVHRVPMRQWMLKITDYAESLLDGLDDLDWPDNVKQLQKNWIGKSEGSNVNFEVDSLNSYIEIYTTRPDTLFGATYLVLAPEHPLVIVISDKKFKSDIDVYRQAAEKKSDLDRGELNKDKTGLFIGAYALNPVSNKKIPIWISDYVLMGYGTGAIMAVPAHDARDYEFAIKYTLPIIEVVSGGDTSSGAYTNTEHGTLVNSSNNTDLDLNRMKVHDAKKHVIKWLEKKGLGIGKIEYKLRDWLFSRQRYWGEPIPIIHGKNNEIKPLEDKDLPLALPIVDRYEPTGTGESPLASIAEWVNTTDGVRETNTMPQWAGSCWYYLRYTDPLNNDKAWGKNQESYWMPVDLYVGGVEHAVLHLLYARFWHHVLYDLGLVSTKEPFKRLFNQGMIGGEDGQKMSKSRGNVINPDEIVSEYGTDSFRLYEMFMGPLDKAKPWNTKGLQGCHRFIMKIWRIYTSKNIDNDNKSSADETKIIFNKTIKKVTEDIEKLSFNTAVSQMMIFVNHLQSQKSIDKDILSAFLIILNPFAPHISEELYFILGSNKQISSEDWPEHDSKYINEDKVNIVIQFNGKKKGIIELASDLEEHEILNNIKSDKDLSKLFIDIEILKNIYIKNKLVNFVVKIDK